MALQGTPNFKLTPTSTKVVTPTNYVSIYDYSHQYLPDVYNEMAKIYGNRRIVGLLRMMGAEVGTNSDTFIWTEEGRLHTRYSDVTRVGNVFTKNNHVFRVNEKVQVSDANDKKIGIITAVTANTFTMASYSADAWGSLGAANISAFVIGSEFQKGTNGMTEALEKDFTVYKNKPTIKKDVYITSGSDATNVGWIDTGKGYYWYLASEYETRLRFEDRLELDMILGQSADAASGAEVNGYPGSEGLFQAVRERGNFFQGIATDIPAWDTIVDRFDKQGAIQDYTFYCDRAQSLAIDDMLGELNAGYDGGISYGIFENGKQQAIDLGFRSFKRGTYNFHKMDWKLLNQPELLGGENVAQKTRALLIPMGMKDVYEGYKEDGASKGKVHYLHMKYKQGPADNRRNKTWTTGSVGGVATDDFDGMKIHSLSESGLCVVGANNFMLFEGNV